MAKWEYLVIQVGYPAIDRGGYVKWVNGKVDKRFGKNSTRIYDALQTLGAEGRELVAVDNPSTNISKDPHYIFKRPA